VTVRVHPDERVTPDTVTVWPDVLTVPAEEVV
jgi:hypothetical protein